MAEEDEPRNLRPTNALRVSVDEEPQGRATVQLVYRAVDDLGRLTEAHFAAINAKMDTLATLPAEVRDLREKHLLLSTRVEAVEKSDVMSATAADRRRDYRAKVMPTIMLGIGGLVLAALNLVVLIHGG